MLKNIGSEICASICALFIF